MHFEKRKGGRKVHPEEEKVGEKCIEKVKGGRKVHLKKEKVGEKCTWKAKEVEGKCI